MTPEQAFKQHIKLANRIAGGFMRKLPSWVQREDIEAAAHLGLWKASLKRSDHPSFEFYASLRIRGAILDELRTQDWLPRRSRSTFAAEFKRVSFDSFDSVDSLSWLAVEEDFDRFEIVGRSRWLETAIARLPERERLVVRRVLAGHKQMEIAAELGVSPARISQNLSSAGQTLRMAFLRVKDRSMMKPMTGAEIRDWVQTLPAEHQAGAGRAIWSAHDNGLSAGLVGQARGLNPFEILIALPPEQPKRKAR